MSPSQPSSDVPLKMDTNVGSATESVAVSARVSVAGLLQELKQKVMAIAAGIMPTTILRVKCLYNVKNIDLDFTTVGLVIFYKRHFSHRHRPSGKQ